MQELVDERAADVAVKAAALKGDRVELVREQHAGRDLPRLREGNVQAALAHAEERVEDLFDSHVRKRQAAFSCSRTRKESLAAAGGPE